MTINKCQGQTLNQVGVYLREPVFTHGQLYVAISRVTSREGLSMVIEDEEGVATASTKNIVYREILDSV
jgi:ATP-dependent exoDNAse (exonuclease V) alpha subunit